jgi:hypothetical protein
MSLRRAALAAALLLCISRPQAAGEPQLAARAHVSSRCVSPLHASVKASASCQESAGEGGTLRWARPSTCHATLSLRVRGGGGGGGDTAEDSSGEFDPEKLRIEDLADSDYWEEIGEPARDALRKVGRAGASFLKAVVWVELRWCSACPAKCRSLIVWPFRFWGGTPGIFLVVIDSGLDKERRHLSPGGVPREQTMLQGHLPRVIYHRVYLSIQRVYPGYFWWVYRGTSLIRNSCPLRPYTRTIPRVLRWS